MVAKYVLQELNTTPINNVKTKEKRFVTFFCTRLTSRCLRLDNQSTSVSQCRSMPSKSQFVLFHVQQIHYLFLNLMCKKRLQFTSSKSLTEAV